jgi:hypothetical protein
MRNNPRILQLIATKSDDQNASHPYRLWIRDGDFEDILEPFL